MKEIIISAELKSHFLSLYQIALSDGEFSVLEVKMLYEFAEARGVPKRELDKILLNAQESSIKAPESIEQKIEYLCDFVRMIWADGIVHDDEQNALEKYIKHFEFLDENIEPLAAYLIEAIKEGKTQQEIFNELNS